MVTDISLLVRLRYDSDEAPGELAKLAEEQLRSVLDDLPAITLTCKTVGDYT